MQKLEAELIHKKKQVERSRGRKNELNGRLKEIFETLKTKYNITSEKQLNQEQNLVLSDLRQLDKKRNKLLKKLEADYDWH